MSFALSNRLTAMCAGTIRLPRNALVIIIIRHCVERPVRLILLPRDVRPRDITIYG